MSVFSEIRDKRQINPLLSLVFILLVAGIISGISFAVFWQSSTKDTVQSIQRQNQNFDGTAIVAEGLDDDDERLSAAELLFIQEELEKETSKLQPDLDFGGTELDKSVIGF